jgi:hypothetical protein
VSCWKYSVFNFKFHLPYFFCSSASPSMWMPRFQPEMKALYSLPPTLCNSTFHASFVSSLLSSFLGLFTVGLFMTYETESYPLSLILQPIMINFWCVYSTLHVCFVYIERLLFFNKYVSDDASCCCLCLCTHSTAIRHVIRLIFWKFDLFITEVSRFWKSSGLYFLVVFPSSFILMTGY